MSLQKQNLKYLNDNLTKSFNVLSVSGSYKLIGSSNIRNILYNSDYDINEEIKINDDKYQSLYQHFLRIFHECHSNPTYYILDFKNGNTINDEPIRWTYPDMQKGYIIDNNTKYTFVDCLKQEPNIIKIDLCVIVNNQFTDVTNNYFFHSCDTEEELKKMKKAQKKDYMKGLQNDIDSYINENKYMKAIKRKFALERIKGKLDNDLLTFLNSDYGMLYKAIHDLELVLLMLQQTFKPLPNKYIFDNLQVIKQNLSHITTFNIDKFLDELVDMCKNEIKLESHLETLIDELSKFLNNQVKVNYNKWFTTM